MRRGQRDHHQPLRIGAQRHRHLDLVLRRVGGARVVAFRHAVAGLREAHRHRRVVVVRDGHHGLRRRRGAHPRGQSPEGQTHPLTVVVDRVLLRAELERLRRVPAHERHLRWHTGVIRARRAVHVGQGDRHLHPPLGIRAQLHRHGGCAALRRAEARLPKAHRHRRMVVIRDRHRGRCRRTDAHARRQGAAEAQLHRLSVVVHGIGRGTERERLRCVAVGERDVSRHPRVVVRARPALVRRRQRDHHLPLRIRAQRHGHFDLVLRRVGGARVVAFGHAVARLPEAHRDRRIVVVRNRHRGRRRGAGAHARRQVAEAKLDAFAIVVHRVLNCRKVEFLLGVARAEGDGGQPSHVVGAGRASLLGRRQRNLHRPLRVGAQLHLHGDVAPLRRRISRLSEAHVHRRHVVVGDRHRRRQMGPRAHPGREVPQRQLHRLPVVIHVIGSGAERNRLRRLAAGKREAGRHAGIVFGP